MYKREKFVVTVKALALIRPFNFHRGDILHCWISSAEGGVNGCIWLKLVERYLCFSSIINTHTSILCFVGDASLPADGKVARVLRG